MLFNDINKFWDILKDWVFYNHPVFNRLEKIKRLKRKTVILVDTDSNFINLNRWIQFLYKNKIIEDKYDNITKFRMINTLAIIITRIANTVCGQYCDYSNVPEDKKPLLNMKNEF